MSFLCETNTVWVMSVTAYKRVSVILQLSHNIISVFTKGILRKLEMKGCGSLYVTLSMPLSFPNQIFLGFLS